MSVKEVYPFTSLSWRTQEIRDKWEPVRQEINRVAHIAEYEMIKEGHRHCDVYSFSAGNFDYEINWVIDHGFYPLTILRSRNYEGFGHRHYHADKIGPDVFIYSVIADTYENAKKFQQASLGEVDHKIIGQLLGYPDCCIDWFLPVWIGQRVADPMFELAVNTPGSEMITPSEVSVKGHPMLNRFARYFGLCVSPFFPHSLTCPDAIKFCNNWYKIMHKHAPYESERLLELLSMPLTWSHNNMIVRVDHPLFKAATNGFDWVEGKKVQWSS